MVRPLRNLLLLLACVFTLAACGLAGSDGAGPGPGDGQETVDVPDGDLPGDDVPDDGVPGDDSPDPNDPSTASLLLIAVNQARASGTKCGEAWRVPTAPLTLNTQLLAAAQAHSDDMLTMRKMSHTGSDGSGPGDRIRRTGYRAGWWGENVAAGYRSVEQVMAGWLGSPGHCENIMNPNFTEFGAGEAGYYWTQVFGRPR